MPSNEKAWDVKQYGAAWNSRSMGRYCLLTVLGGFGGAARGRCLIGAQSATAIKVVGSGHWCVYAFV